MVLEMAAPSQSEPTAELDSSQDCFFLELYHVDNFSTFSLSLDEIVQSLGKGSFGEVFRVRHKTTLEYFVFKFLTIQPKNVLNPSLDEFYLPSRFDFKYLMKVYSMYHAPLEKKISICFRTEYCPGGDLRSLLRNEKNKNPTYQLPLDVSLLSFVPFFPS
jgi:serine/threonine protein kinase